MWTIDALIDELGGTGAVASSLGIKPSAVSNWRARGEVPMRHHFRLWRLCQERGLDWTPPETAAGSAA